MILKRLVRLTNELSNSTSTQIFQQSTRRNRTFGYLNKYVKNESHMTSISNKTGYILAFVLIFLIVLLAIFGRVIYSINDSSVHLMYLKYHRNSLAASALNTQKSNSNNPNSSSSFH